jgi:hypothetical protein
MTQPSFRLQFTLKGVCAKCVHRRFLLFAQPHNLLDVRLAKDHHVAPKVKRLLKST